MVVSSARAPLALALAFAASCGNKQSNRPPDPAVAPLRPTQVEPTKPAESPAASVAQAASTDTDLPLSKLKLPKGFRIGIYADEVEDARSMTRSPDGTVYVGTRREGKVYAIPDADKNNVGDKVIEVASGLDMPNGVVFHDGALYVAENSRVIRFDEIESALPKPPRPVVVRDGFPEDDDHGWKYMALGPDSRLYVPIGAPCNICDPKSPYASITRMNLDGTGFEVFARGVRNTLGFDWHPTTRELWFTENGRDMMGDDKPGDELNRAPKQGMHFGYPYCHQGDIVDPELGKPDSCKKATPPERVLAPHVAALGMRFYQGEMFPPAYRHQILIAEHGSWNRSDPLGYRLMRVTLDEKNEPTSYEVFIEGWLQDGKPWGRPVDLLLLPDGSLLVSDDTADVIYRVTYEA